MLKGISAYLESPPQVFKVLEKVPDVTKGAQMVLEEVLVVLILFHVSFRRYQSSVSRLKWSRISQDTLRKFWGP